MDQLINPSAQLRQGEPSRKPGTPQSIVVCDDSTEFRQRLARAIRDRGVRTYEAPEAATALEVVRDYEPEGAIVDLRMPGESGLWLVRELKAVQPAIRIVVLTGFGSITTAIEAIRLGAVHYVTKPSPVDAILRAFTPQDGSAPPAPSQEICEPSLKEVQSDYIHRVLAERDGNISMAAKVLKVHRRSLQRWLKGG